MDLVSRRFGLTEWEEEEWCKAGLIPKLDNFRSPPGANVATGCQVNGFCRLIEFVWLQGLEYRIRGLRIDVFGLK